MYASFADVIVHVDESLTSEELHNLEDAVRFNGGVFCVGTNEKTPHLMMVYYDSDIVSSKNILARVKSRGLHAELVGL